MLRRSKRNLIEQGVEPHPVLGQQRHQGRRRRRLPRSPGAAASPASIVLGAAARTSASRDPQPVAFGGAQGASGRHPGRAPTSGISRSRNASSSSARLTRTAPSLGAGKLLGQEGAAVAAAPRHQVTRVGQRLRSPPARCRGDAEPGRELTFGGSGIPGASTRRMVCSSRAAVSSKALPGRTSRGRVDRCRSVSAKPIPQVASSGRRARSHPTAASRRPSRCRRRPGRSTSVMNDASSLAGNATAAQPVPPARRTGPAARAPAAGRARQDRWRRVPAAVGCSPDPGTGR